MIVIDVSSLDNFSYFVFCCKGIAVTAAGTKMHQNEADLSNLQ